MAQSTPNHKELDAFLALSAVLTGYESIDLAGTGCAEEYYEWTARAAGADNLHKLLDTWRKKVERGPASGLDRRMRELFSRPDLGPIARALITLWYTGSWTQLPETWRREYGAQSDQTANQSIVVSAQAYREGLVWPAIGAHPMGAKQPGFGTWAEKPHIPEV